MWFSLGLGMPAYGNTALGTPNQFNSTESKLGQSHATDVCRKDWVLFNVDVPIFVTQVQCSRSELRAYVALDSKIGGDG